MKVQRSFASAAILALAALAGAPAYAQQVGLRVARPVNPDRATVRDAAPRVQIALLLDTSNSMDGLIEQAKAQLWSVVNELATSKRDGKRPILEVALVEYGKQSLSGESGFVRIVVPMTRDLDKISEELFALTTNGGEEYCGWAVQTASTLAWSTRSEDLKLLFIAGNEPFNQGPIDYQKSVPDAIAKGIVVNTIHCGERQVGIDTGWMHGAQLADGEFAVLDINQPMANITAPQDEELSRLGVELNRTYIPWGAEGEKGQARQAGADALSAGISASNLAERANAKASALYWCSWDLCDAIKGGQVKLAEVKEADLPEPMKKMTLTQREEHIAKMLKEREAVQSKIQTLHAQREQHVAEERRKLAEAGLSTIDYAIIRAVRRQAEAVKLVFDKPLPPEPAAAPREAPKPEPAQQVQQQQIKGP